jgi:hypothetical protein
MKLMSWILGSTRHRRFEAQPTSAEKDELRAELAQKVVTFERRRHTVQQIANEALQSMREGHNQ